MMAAKTMSIPQVLLLLDKGADPNDADEDQNTALTHAVLSENIESAETLITKTTEHLDVTLRKLAESKFQFGGNM